MWSAFYAPCIKSGRIMTDGYWGEGGDDKWVVRGGREFLSSLSTLIKIIKIFRCEYWRSMVISKSRS